MQDLEIASLHTKVTIESNERMKNFIYWKKKFDFFYSRNLAWMSSWIEILWPRISLRLLQILFWVVTIYFYNDLIEKMNKKFYAEKTFWRCFLHSKFLMLMVVEPNLCMYHSVLLDSSNFFQSLNKKPEKKRL